jgi:hypothetical protein
MEHYCSHLDSIWNVAEIPGNNGINNLEITSDEGVTFEFTYEECLSMKFIQLERLFPSYNGEEFEDLEIAIEEYLAHNHWLEGVYE